MPLNLLIYYYYPWQDNYNNFKYFQFSWFSSIFPLLTHSGDIHEAFKKEFANGKCLFSAGPWIWVGSIHSGWWWSNSIFHLSGCWKSMLADCLKWVRRRPGSHVSTHWYPTQRFHAGPWGWGIPAAKKGTLNFTFSFGPGCSLVVSPLSVTEQRWCGFIQNKPKSKHESDFSHNTPHPGPLPWLLITISSLPFLVWGA